MELRRAILARLSDGVFHSGATLARDLGRSRTAVWKGVRGLVGAGLDIFAIRGKGYRLAEPLELLDAGLIRDSLDAEAARALNRLDVFFTLVSTNDFLLREARPHGNVVLAEFQTAGRGRRGNRWVSPPASGICLSLGWRFESAPDSLMMLSLFSAVAVLRALQCCGITGVGLKWPNDMVHEDRKLGGILVESRGQIAGAVDVVIGLGLNVRLPPNVGASVDQPVTDLASIGGAAPSRNRLAALSIAQLLRMCRDCQAGETPAYLQEWRNHDVGRGRPARLKLPDREVAGRVLDIDERGLLIMQIAGREQRFSSGELSLRLGA
ncbi:MAG: biotin--[acetyl-CoA-carboxylase] ligase [Gammaproteobacteria bacterium]|nr:biotin--[acetyl-CoA-carboxylase] ligase [Gammaproteobacteria bacterium]